ncbi:MAG: T9SS type A sorting domain-containing protein [Cyclobacteriaceae bacterium]
MILKTDITYTVAAKVSGKLDTLKFDIAYMNQSTNANPAILLFHGGAFKHGDKSSFQEELVALALAGYTVISANYRLGWKKGDVCVGVTNSFLYALYRSVQDGYSLIDFLSRNSQEFRVDLNKLVLGGSSAGSILAQTMVYNSQKDFDGLDISLSQNLGALYPASLTIFHPKAMINMWGAISSNINIDHKGLLPTISFQSIDDTVLDYDVGNIGECVDFKIFVGAKRISQLIHDTGGCYETNVTTEPGHRVFSVDYRIFRITKFLESLWNSQCDQTILENEVLVSSIRPSDLKVEVGENISLSWIDNSFNETGFLIKRIGLSQSQFFASTDELEFIDRSTIPDRRLLYTVSSISPNGFSKSDTTEIVITNIKDQPDDRVFISPNPVQSYFDLHIPNLGFRYAAIKMTSPTGSLILDQVVNENIRVDVTPYKSGVYTLSIELKDEIIYRKIIIN